MSWRAVLHRATPGMRFCSRVMSVNQEKTVGATSLEKP